MRPESPLDTRRLSEFYADPANSHGASSVTGSHAGQRLHPFSVGPVGAACAVRCGEPFKAHPVAQAPDIRRGIGGFPGEHVFFASPEAPDPLPEHRRLGDFTGPKNSHGASNVTGPHAG